MSKSVATSRQNGRIAGKGDDGQTFAEVNLDEKDSAKAIERHQEQALPPSEDLDGDEVSAAPRTADSREWRRRVRRVENRLQRGFDQKVAEIEARHQRELRDLRGDVDGLKTRRSEDPDTSALDAAHESAMAAMQTALENAIEKGDSPKAAELTRKMARAENEYWAKKRGASDEELRRQKERDSQREQRRQRDTEEERRDEVTPEGQRFMDMNDDWWGDEDFEIETQAAIVIDRQLMREHSDPKSPAHYRKLAKRLREKFPDLEVKVRKARDEDLDDEDDDEEEDMGTRQRSKTRRPAVPGFRDNGQAEGLQTRARNGRRVTLTQEDRANMRRFNLDPENDGDVSHYARGKEESGRGYREQ